MHYRLRWIDILRGVAILAVVTDHTMYIYNQYQNSAFQKHLYFSVAWFVFLAGYTGIMSYDRYPGTMTRKILTFWARRIRIVLAYLACSVLAYLMFTRGYSLDSLFDTLVNFTALPPFYYFMALFSLYFISPVFFFLLRYRTSVASAAAGILLTILLSVCLGYFGGDWRWQIRNVFLGGPYLPVYFLGMILFRFERSIRSPFFTGLPVIIFGIAEYVFLRSGGAALIEFEPTVYSIFWSVCFLLAARYLCLIIPENNPATGFLAWLGRHSLLIFLTHYAVLLQYREAFASQSHPMIAPLMVSLLGIPVLREILQVIIGAFGARIPVIRKFATAE